MQWRTTRSSNRGDSRLDGFPNAGRFLELASALPQDSRHLDLHTGHLTELNAVDREVVTDDAMSVTPLTCYGHELPARLERLAEQGITNVAFQPMGDVHVNSTPSPRPQASGSRMSRHGDVTARRSSADQIHPVAGPTMANRNPARAVQGVFPRFRAGPTSLASNVREQERKSASIQRPPHATRVFRGR